MANKTIQPITIDGKTATAVTITSTTGTAGRCKVTYSLGNFNPSPKPGVWTSLKTGKFWLDYDDEDDGEIYEYLLGKIVEKESLTVTGVITPPTPD